VPFLERAGIHFYYEVSGDGPPLVFCHGLTGDLEQSKELIQPLSGFRLIVWDARGHGKTNPAGSIEGFTFDTFSEDLAGLLDHLEIPSAVVGGVSMGAAVSTRLAIHYPNRVKALLLVRPAWLEQTLPEGLRLHARVGDYLEVYGVERGFELFQELSEYQAVKERHPDVAAGVIGQFSQLSALQRRGRLQGIPRDAPIRSWQEVEALSSPALVIGNDSDYVHPWDYATTWAEHLTAGQLVKVPPRPIDFPTHAKAVRKCLNSFLAPFRAPFYQENLCP
jgi:pimeloyl-ACP methyl ester carboxylesterase